MTRILYLEDDPIIRNVTLDYLHLQSYDIDAFEDGHFAQEAIMKHHYDCAILDIMVPNVSGLDILRELALIQPDCGIIMLTALGDVNNQLEAFNHHADDYIIKPFSPLLLIKRVEAVLRRTRGTYSDQALFISSEGYQVFHNQVSLNLTVTEFLLFEALYTQPSRVFQRDTLLDIIAPDDFMVSDRVIDAHIKNLRKKLPLPYIKTVVGIGYQFDETQL